MAMNASNPAVEARDLVKHFDGTRAVDGVSLSVPAGAIYGILGPNGAGIETLSIERPGLHDAFVAIAGEAAARDMGQPNEVAA